MKTSKERLEYAKEYREKNREKVAASKKRSYEKNKAKYAAQNKAWASENRERKRANNARWEKANRDKFKTYPSRSPEASRAKHLMLKYGLTEEQFEEMAESQNHRCAICKKKRKLCVDHCHETKKIRGLLCRTCNAGIGQLGDSYDGVLSALNYLENYNA